MASLLLVDDERDAAEALKAFFDLQGIPCWVATDGDQALALALAQRPDVILLDVHLESSRLSGFDVLQKVKRQLPATKVIVVSGYHDAESHAQARRLGADGYLEKPLTPQTILETLTTLA